jgi:hypothetical protein
MLPMPGGSDGDVTLFDAVQKRLAEARERLAAMDLSDEVREAALKRLNRLDRASHHDLSLTSREVEGFHIDLDAGEVPIYDQPH